LNRFARGLLQHTSGSGGTEAELKRIKYLTQVRGVSHYQALLVHVMGLVDVYGCP
jgi:hypothetical protein